MRPSPPVSRPPRRRLARLSLALLLGSCANGDSADTPGTDASAVVDAPASPGVSFSRDAGGSSVAPPPHEAGSVVMPSGDGPGATSDAATTGGGSDAGFDATLEAGHADGGTLQGEAGPRDAAVVDSHVADAGGHDAAVEAAHDAAVDAAREGGQAGDATAADAGAADGATSEAGPRDSAAKDSATADAGGCALGHLVISQVQSRGVAGGNDEWVELYNPTASAVTLDATWGLDARSSTASTFGSRWVGTSTAIPPRGHFLVVGTAYAGAPTADGSLTTGITDASSVRLTHGGAVVDVVCYAYSTATSQALTSDATYDCPGSPATNPHGDTTATDVASSIERRPGGVAGNCTDTGSSAADFVTDTTSDPRDTASAATP